MPGLADLQNVPGLTGYIAGEQAAQNEAMAPLQRVGAIMGILSAQQQIQKLKREQDIRDQAAQAIAKLGPGALQNPDALTNLGLQQLAAGEHQLGSGLITAANQQRTLQNRRDPSQMERALDTIAELHRKDSMKPGSLSPEEQTKLNNAVAIVGQVRTALDPVTQRMETIQPLTLPALYNPMLERYGVRNAKPADVFPNPAGNGRKQIDQGSEKELQGFNDASTQLFSLAREFKPTYGGWMLDSVGQAAIMAGRRLPDSALNAIGKPGLKDQAAWWERYYNWSNDVRAAKFGLTLTGNELTAFERATPKPSDTPEQIAQALKAQLEILTAKQQNRTSGLVAGGYNPEQVRATAGHERYLTNTDEEAIAAVEQAGKRGMLASARGGPIEQQFPKPSPAAIRRLQMNPSEKAQFEAVFGPGSAAAYGVR